MADEDSQKAQRDGEDSSLAVVASEPKEPKVDELDVEFEGGTPANLGSIKYVHAAFFAAGVLVAFLTGKILAAGWNTLAETPAVYEHAPFLLSYAEDERPNLTMPVGLVVGAIAVFWTYRKEGIERWATEVASELSKVHWPDKETVSNGTIVVIVVSTILTLYVGLLDRIWGFVTTLVYGT